MMIGMPLITGALSTMAELAVKLRRLAGLE